MSRPDGAGEFPPIVARRNYDAPSVLTPANLLREARRQKGLPEGKVPRICVLDPDGDLVDELRAALRAAHHPSWACYHTDLDVFVHAGVEFGIIGRVVGAPFAVLVTEELFASGCELLISVTSAGQLRSLGTPPYVVLLEKALRDEGTSYHYLPPATWSIASPALVAHLRDGWEQDHVLLHVGASWTTDAPFRETEDLIAAGAEQGILSIEMEAAALYALATVRGFPILCFAHVTNQFGQTEGDFEKGASNGSHTMLEILRQTAHLWSRFNSGREGVWGQ